MTLRAQMYADDVYGAVVVGAGPAGATAALVLARAGVRVALVDGSRREQPGRDGYKVGETLPSAAAQLLRDLGLWGDFTVGARTHLRSTGVYASWGSPDLHERGSLGDPYGPGWQLDRLRFDAILREEAGAAGAELLDGRVVESTVDPSGTGLLVRCRCGSRELRCRWSVDATGRRSVLARRRATHRRHDRLTAAHVLLPGHAMNVRAAGTSMDREARTLVEAVAGGWWYTTLTPGGRVVAYLTDSDLTDSGLRTPSGFLDAAASTRHVGLRLTQQDFTDPPRPRWSPAHGQLLSPCCGPGWIAAGDAAVAADPLSSQGILSALHTGARAGLATALCLAGAPPGPVLDSYTAFLDGVTRSYAHHHAEAYALEQRWPERPFWRRRARSRQPDTDKFLLGVGGAGPS